MPYVRARAQKPPLIVLVLAASFVLVGVTLVALAFLVRTHMVNFAVERSVEADRRAVLSVASEAQGPMSRTALLELVELRDLDSATLHRAGTTAVDTVSSPTTGTIARATERNVVDALAGQPSIELRETDRTLYAYLPIVRDGAIVGALVLFRDARAILSGAEAATRDVVVVGSIGGAVLASLLVLVFRSAQGRLWRQARELTDAVRHDPVTGLLNHGAVLDLIADALEVARRERGWLVVALVDIDNFRLLNELHGHAVGDRALRLVAEVLRREAPAGSIVGRSGPDEFVLATPPAGAPAVRPAIDRMQAGLRDLELAVPGAERLPLTVSVGISTYPEHAGAMTELLAAAARMLTQAKVGGGDNVRVDAPDDERAADRWPTFDVLQGLIFAVDAKDRYTKRHSEDVARHALLLAEQLDLDARSLDEVRLAGLLHDVGKIAVPDELLRKPAPLTAHEKEIVVQHVIVGDLIVSALPDLQNVAAGVRHHHERWDGTGYPDQLREAAIPRIARIIAIADAFSAMTTTRAYRRAVPRGEALRRLADAAGSQLDPDLTPTFIAALERLPSLEETDDESAASLWLVRSNVA